MAQACAKAARLCQQLEQDVCLFVRVFVSACIGPSPRLLDVVEECHLLSQIISVYPCLNEHVHVKQGYLSIQMRKMRFWLSASKPARSCLASQLLLVGPFLTNTHITLFFFSRTQCLSGNMRSQQNLVVQLDLKENSFPSSFGPVLTINLSYENYSRDYLPTRDGNCS